MEQRKVFFYTVKNLTDEKSVLKKIRDIIGVNEANIDNGILSYEIDERLDEYDIMRSAMEIVENCGGEFGFLEENAETSFEISEETNFSEDKFKNKENIESVDKDNEQSEEADRVTTLEVNFDEDELVLAKKNYKNDLWSKILEFSVATICFILGVLTVDLSSETFFTASNILFIFAFAVAASECLLYSSFIAIKNRDFLNEAILLTVVSLLLVVTSLLMEATLLVLIYALAKTFENTIETISLYRKSNAFYVGKPEININGEVKPTATLKKGDEIEIINGDTIPCDGFVLNDCEVDFKRFNSGIVELSKGDGVLAGSIVCSEKVKISVTNNCQNCVLKNAKKKFENKQAQLEYRPWKYFKYISLIVSVACILLMFLLPISSDDYLTSLASYGIRFLPAVALASICYPIRLISNTYKVTKFMSNLNAIDFSNEKAILKMSNCNSLKISEAVFSDNSELKADTIGAMLELRSEGIKNINTIFDGETINQASENSFVLSEAAREQVDFVETPLKKENNLTVGIENSDINYINEENDITKFVFENEQNDKLIYIASTEVKTLPKAYKTAKKYKKLRIAQIILGVLGLICLPLSLVVPSAVFVSLFFAHIGIGFYAISSAITTISFLADK